MPTNIHMAPTSFAASLRLTQSKRQTANPASGGSELPTVRFFSRRKMVREGGEIDAHEGDKRAELEKLRTEIVAAGHLQHGRR